MQIDEKSPIGTTVGTVMATDLDPTDNLTYRIIAGNTNGAFVIDSTTAVITIANPTDFSALPQMV